MRVLIVDNFGGDGALDFAMRCLDDGHKVKWFYRDMKAKCFGKGLVDLVDDWRPWGKWPDLVFLTDNVKHLDGVDGLRRAGVPVVGATPEAAKWELDRTYGQALLKKHGIAVAPYREFSDYDQAIAYVKRENRRFVSKPCGDEDDKSLSYCSKDPADMVYMLQRWKKNGKLKGKFILQEFVGGTEMAVGGWFGPGGFNAGWCENFEFKKLMAGDTGPNTGEMGTVLRYARKSKLADLVLKPIEDALERVRYCGYVDVNCIIDEKGVPYPLEFTMRPGWPTFNIQQALVQGDHAEWLAALAEGRDTRSARLNEIAVGVVLAIPDFPYSRITRKDVYGIPIGGLTARHLRNVHPCGMMQGVAPQMVNDRVVETTCLQTAGDYVLVASGVSETVRLARERAYRILEKVRLPNSPFWRPDIGERLKKQLPDLQTMGFATDFQF